VDAGRAPKRVCQANRADQVTDSRLILGRPRWRDRSRQ
jgi:hypothetical protein